MDKRRLIFSLICVVFSLFVFSTLHPAKGGFYSFMSAGLTLLPFLIAFVLSTSSDRKNLTRIAFLKFKTSATVYLYAAVAVFLPLGVQLLFGLARIQFPELPHPLQTYLHSYGVSRKEFALFTITASLTVTPGVLMVLFIPSEMAWRGWFSKGGERFLLFLSGPLWAIYSTLNFAYFFRSPEGTFLCFLYNLSLGFAAVLIYRAVSSVFATALFISVYLSVDGAISLFLQTDHPFLAGDCGITKAVFIVITAFLLKKTLSQRL